ncbi:large subunit ribosomal protein L3 [Methanomicrobium sp. W14]|jgi:large subunit ribosomal protein L3|uniref:50S ribosomal protein L3 n=1 Tax=Methanomicrobium sp. W14 TaxID=2817839 RepID=UPI001AE41E09|nr:50S ribosomal protein L3 [Methanomicrobium sp. W14]MBP2133171.1 large subunit ribosomal protein L3 [Methanomicrobium sp. W14]
MAQISRPRRGSLAYSPRKRAKSQVPKYNSWPEYEGEPKLQGFAGYKAGMTHIVMVDDHKNSPSEGREISVPVTIVEIPPMKVVAVRAYSADTYGRHAFSEVWAEDVDETLDKRVNVPKKSNAEENTGKIREAIEKGIVSDIFALMYTQPSMLSGVPKKVPDMMEVRVAGGDVMARLDFAAGLLGKEVEFDAVSDVGKYLDVTAVTTGKGTEGPVRRWGIQVKKSKHSRQGKKRHIGNLGPWTPHHVRWQVPQMGQMGYQQRTEFNKRVLKVGDSPDEVNPEGGFVKYGLVRGKYIAIKGSVPGPVKRLIRLRPAIRNRDHVDRVPSVSYVSTMSKQG